MAAAAERARRAAVARAEYVVELAAGGRVVGRTAPLRAGPAGEVVVCERFAAGIDAPYWPQPNFGETHADW